MNKQKNIPELRFPEFTGEWENKKLEEVSEIIMGQSPEGDSYNTIGEGTALINGPVEFTEKYPVKTKWTTKPTKFCRDKDILFCVRGSTTGRMNIANDAYCIGRGIAAIRANSKSTTEFIEFLILKNLIAILTLTSGSTFFNLDSKSLKEFSLYLPSLPEQQKIASFLTAIDDKLQALKKKKALLEQYKKGVMQSIFSQQLRFTDEGGKDYPEWESKKLVEVAVSIQSGKDKTENDGDYDVFGSMGIIGKTSNYSYDGKFILIARVGANAGTINVVSGKYSVSDNTLILICKDEIDIDFCFYLLVCHKLNKLAFGSGQPLITAGQLKSLKIMLPTFPEQIKIANFLTAIDEKIKHCQTQIEKTEQYKKGLLQKMFC